MKNLFCRLRLTVGLLAVPPLALLPGCSLFRSSTETITVTAQPADAEILINGARLTSPVKLAVPRNRNLLIQCMKDGYYPVTVNTGYALNTTGVLDVIGLVLILVPGVGLLSSGAWSLDQTEFSFTLQKK